MTSGNNKNVEAEIFEASYYKIEGKCWNPQKPSVKLSVSLIDSNNLALATMTADRPGDNSASERERESQIGEGFSFIFHGLLHGVKKIRFADGDTYTDQALNIDEPSLPDYMSEKGFYLLHPDDFLLKFNLAEDGIERRVRAYIHGGMTVANELSVLCRKYLPDTTRPLDVLDFASGYGRVTRSLNNSLFNATSSDIHEAAMTFIAKETGGETLLSTSNPLDFTCDRLFDVVFAFSFFSHMPSRTYGDWLAVLYKLVRPGGLLIFTTHGRITTTNAGLTISDGYGFWPEGSEQKDIEESDYGTTVSELPWVLRVLEERIGQYPVLFEEGSSFTGGGQDLYVVQKDDQYSRLNANDHGISRTELASGLAAQKQQYESTISWRVTRPLRAVRAVLANQK
ncbi:MAG: class I SAM-dependent methyltransferase [Promicromonosporaceae bacterium]|nr:class I SAM-dependent methyltransferase [Promicromonosporaceae bacterium]